MTNQQIAPERFNYLCSRHGYAPEKIRALVGALEGRPDLTGVHVEEVDRGHDGMRRRGIGHSFDLEVHCAYTGQEQFFSSTGVGEQPEATQYFNELGGRTGIGFTQAGIPFLFAGHYVLFRAEVDVSSPAATHFYAGGDNFGHRVGISRPFGERTIEVIVEQIGAPMPQAVRHSRQ